MGVESISPRLIHRPLSEEIRMPHIVHTALKGSNGASVDLEGWINGWVPAMDASFYPEEIARMAELLDREEIGKTLPSHGEEDMHARSFLLDNIRVSIFRCLKHVGSTLLGGECQVQLEEEPYVSVAADGYVISPEVVSQRGRVVVYTDTKDDWLRKASSGRTNTEIGRMMAVTGQKPGGEIILKPGNYQRAKPIGPLHERYNKRFLPVANLERAYVPRNKTEQLARNLAIVRRTRAALQAACAALNIDPK